MSIDTEKLQARLERAECCVIDVRTPAEYGSSFIEGSHNVPLGDLTKEIETIKERADTKDLVLVCRSGKRAQAAREQLAEHGLSQILVLEGGIEAWQQSGGPIGSTRAGAMSIERQVRIIAGLLIVLGAVLALTVNPLFALLSGFVGAGLAFAGITDTCGMGIMLAKMPWNRA